MIVFVLFQIAINDNIQDGLGYHIAALRDDLRPDIRVGPLQPDGQDLQPYEGVGRQAANEPQDHLHLLTTLSLCAPSKSTPTTRCSSCTSPPSSAVDICATIFTA